MKDKLYKTNKRVGYYRVRSFAIFFVLLGLGAAAITIPYPYVVKAINAYQEEKSSQEQTLPNDLVEEFDVPLV